MAAEDNEFDPIISQMKGEVQRTSLRSTLDSVLDTNPDMAAKQQKLASDAGLKPVEIEGREQEIERFEKIKKAGVDAIVERFPALNKSLNDKNFASISHDDFERLKHIETIAPVMMNGQAGTLEGLSANYDSAKRRYPALLALAYGLGNEEELAQAYVDSVNDADRMSGREPNYMRGYQRDRGRDGALSAIVSNPRAALRMSVEQLPVSVPAIMGGVAGGRAGALGGGAVGSVVPGLGTGAGAAAGGTVGFAVGTFAGSAPYDVADWIDQTMNNAGINTRDPVAVRKYLRSEAFQNEAKQQAEIKGLTNSAINAVYAPFAGRYLRGAAGQGVARTVGAGAAGTAENTVVTALAEGGSQYAATGKVDLDQVAEESLLEVPASAIEVVTSANQARLQQRDARRAGGNDAGGAPEAAAGEGDTAAPADGTAAQPQERGVRGAVKAAAADLAKQKEGEIKAMTEAARTSKTAARNPQAFRDFVAKAAPDEQVYIDGAAAVTFFQTLPPGQQDEIVAVMPDIRDRLMESATTGTDVPISKADYMAFIAPHEEAEALMPHIRFNEDDYTIDDLQNVDDLVDEAEAMGMMDDDAGGLEPDEALGRRLESEFMNAGLTPDAARLDAQLARSAYNAFGEYTDSTQGQRFIQDAFGKLTIRAPQSAPRITNIDRGYVKGIRDFIKTEQRKKNSRGGTVDRVRDMFGGGARKRREKATPKPVISWLARNGIQRGSVVAKELSAIGVTPEKYPSLYTTEERGLRDLDNLPKNEFDSQFEDIGLVAQDDGNGYVDRQYLLEVLRDEDFGKGGMTAEQRERAGRADQYKQTIEYLDRFHDIDVTTATDEEVMAALRSFGDEKTNQPERELFQQAEPVKSAAFKNWFGDSKVVDENGKPLVVYHGTDKDFSSFKRPLRGGKVLNDGFYFTPDGMRASSYAYWNTDTRTGKPRNLKAKLGLSQNKPNVVPVYLSIKNPYRTSDYGSFETAAKLKKAGYDGIVHTEESDGEVTYIAFKPEQVKSIFNQGTFDQNDARILYQTMPQPTFYSALGKAVEGVKQERADAKQWYGVISNAPGVKAEEIEWTGLREWLGEQEGQVRKDEVQAFLEAGGVQVQEVTKDDKNLMADRYVVMNEEGPIADFATREEATAWRDAEEERTGDELELYDPEDLANDGDSPEAAATRFSKYQLPGGENYKELLLTLPPEQRSLEQWRLFDGNGTSRGTYMSEESAMIQAERQGLQYERVADQPVEYGYRSSHFDEKNILAHIRFNERTDADGARVLFLEEVQSDWHQAGRKRGYKNTTAGAAAEKEYQEAGRKQQSRRREMLHESLAAIRAGTFEGGSIRSFDFQGTTMHQPILGEFEWTGTPYESLDDAQHRLSEAYADRSAEARELAARVMRAREAMNESLNGVPDAPFKKTWHEMAMKRMLRYAVENGFDKVAWTTGEQQAERYDLSKQVSSISANPNADGTFNLLIDLKTGGEQTRNNVTAQEVEAFIGKDLAEKIVANGKQWLELNSEYRKNVVVPGYPEAELDATREARDAVQLDFSGLDLRVGGEGMKGFYDKILPSFMNKYTKKWGTKVADISIEQSSNTGGIIKEIDGVRYLERDEDGHSYFIEGGSVWAAPTLVDGTPELENKLRADNLDEVLSPDQLQAIYQSLQDGEVVTDMPSAQAHAVEITDAMRESVMAGQPLFQGTQRDPMGSIAYLPDGRTIINLFEKSNLSTALHEMGHFYWGMLDQMKAGGFLNERGMKDWQAVRDFVGAEEGATLTVDQEEKIARGFEQFLRTGKAPSLELHEAFQRFKAWLMRIYRSAKDLNVEITPEIEAVFSRMLATDAQIEAMKDNKLFRPDPAVMDMLNEDQRARYVRQAEKAVSTAKERLLTKAMRQAEKQNKGPYNEARKKVTEEVTANVSNAAIYKALDAMQKGVLFDGTTFDVKPRLDRRKVKELMGADAINAMPRATMTRGGIDPDIAADMFGYPSGRALIDAMMAAPDKKTRINENVDRVMRDRFGDMLNDGTIEREALDAFHNIDRAAQLEIELKFTADKAGVQAATNREFQLAAARILGDKSVDNVMKSTRFYYAEVKAAREFGKFAARGDWAKAADAKRRQLLNHHLLRQAESARKEVDSALRKFKKLAKPLDVKRAMKIDEDYHNRIRTILEAYSYGPRMSDARRTKLEMQALASWASNKALEDEALIDIPPELGSINEAGEFVSDMKPHYRDLSLEQFRALRDTVLNIEKQGRRKREYTIDGQKRELASVVAEAVDTMGQALPVKVTGRNPSKLARVGKQYFSSLIKGREYLRQLDGGNEQGIFYKAVLRDIDSGMNRFITRQKEAGDKFQELLRDRYTQKELYAMVKDGQVYDGLGPDAITKENLILMALNWGNEGNREALLHGEGWKAEHVEAALATLQKRDWDFVQGVWDWINGYWPEVSALEKRRKGITPKKTEGSPFYAEYAVATPGGATTTASLRMEGGYFPITPDPSRSIRAQEQSTDQWAREMSMGSGAASMTRRNHTKARKGIGMEARPLWLSFGVLPRHVNMVLRDLELGEATHNAQRFLRQMPVKQGIVDRLGMDAFAAMDLWLKDIAVGDLPTGDAFTGIVDRLRANASIAYMGFSISTLVQQFTGLTNSAAAMGSGGQGWKWVAVGIKQLRRAYSRDGAMRMNDIYEASEFMANRAATMTRDINEAVQLFDQGVGNKLGLPPGYRKIFLLHIQKAQSFVDAATWLGALEKAQREGADDNKAVEYADNIVRSQASGLIQDLSGLERGSFTNANRFNRWAKMFTFMYSYFGAKFNLAYGKYADYEAGRISAMEATIDVISLIWVDALLSGIVLDRLPSEDDDDDDFAVRWLKWFVQQPANMFPMAREVSSTLQGFEGSGGGAFGGFLNATASFYTQANQGEADAAFLRATVNLSGIMLGIPSTQINRLINIAERASDGKEVGYIDLIRSRKPSEK